MLTPISWLKQYVDFNDEINTFCEKMIMSGSNIETATHFGDGIEKVVIGKILDIKRHPDADKLVVVNADVGSEVVQIVTGADNIFENAYIPVILHGGKLPGGITIKKGKIRGVDSNGMLCSAKELGLSDKVIPTAHKDGIMILDKEYPLGEDAIAALDFADDIVEFEITPNRPDCLSMMGLAREVAAVYEKDLKIHNFACKKEADDVSKYISIEIKNESLCKRYFARVVKDIKITESPWWMQKRLMAAGVRPINNIVDITNYVMMEMGQPLHAFDIEDIKGGKIVVEVAKNGEKFTTLDQTERLLDEETLLIKDGEKAVALAGIMGGLNSEIKNYTKCILIESANFDKDSVRATSKRIGLRTEASARFEKGIDPNICEQAANRVCYLIEEIGAGTVVKGAVDVYPNVLPSASVEVRTKRVNDILGIDLSTKEISKILNRLEIKTIENQDNVVATPPSCRLDLLKEIDFVEEVARIYGYDNLPTTLPKGSNRGKMSKVQEIKNIAKSVLIGLGVAEIQTYSFASPLGVDKIGISDYSIMRNFVELLNPMGEETSVMRTTLIPNMMEVASRNYTRKIPHFRAFEMGRIFLKRESECQCENKCAVLPEEIHNLCVAVYGEREDFFTLKGMIVEMLEKLGIKNAQFSPESNNPAFHPGRCANILVDDDLIGVIGEIHPNTCERYDFPSKVNLCELNFDLIISLSNLEKFYVQLPKFPAMQRDLAIIVDEKIPVGDLEKVIVLASGKLLEEVELFDVYRGKQISEGFKSVAFSLTYRDKTKTLTEEEVSKINSKVMDALNKSHNAVLRDI